MKFFTKACCIFAVLIFNSAISKAQSKVYKVSLSAYHSANISCSATINFTDGSSENVDMNLKRQFDKYYLKSPASLSYSAYYITGSCNCSAVQNQTTSTGSPTINLSKEYNEYHEYLSWSVTPNGSSYPTTDGFQFDGSVQAFDRTGLEVSGVDENNTICGTSTFNISAAYYQDLPTSYSWSVDTDPGFSTAKILNGSVSSSITLSASYLLSYYPDLLKNNSGNVLYFKCTQDGSIQEKVSLTFLPASPVSFTSSATAPLCNGGTGSIVLSNFKYADGTNYAADQNLIVDVYGNPDESKPIQTSIPFNKKTSLTISDLEPGTYYVRAFNGVTACPIPLKQIVIPPTSAVNITANPQNPDCSTGTGTITVTATGGTPPYTYSKNGAAFQSSNVFSNLTGATTGESYTLVAKDAHGCTATLIKTITTPTAVALSIVNQSSPKGYGYTDGTITVGASGGRGTGYTYTLNGVSKGSTSIFTGLAAGTYTIVAKDSKGCASNSISATLSNPPELTLSASQTNITCYESGNGTITLTAGGGVSPYNYSLDNGLFTGSNKFSNLTPKAYNLTVKDANGVTKSTSVTITQPAKVTAVVTKVNVTCNGAANGSLTITASGGSGTGYTYSINNGSTYSGANKFNVAAGTYIVTVKDSKDCLSDSCPVTVSEPPVLSVTTNTQNVSCKGGNNGKISINASGGTTSYTYSINNGTSWTTTNVFTGLTAGTYFILVKDNAGCSAGKSVTVTEPPLLKLSIDQITNAPCYNTKGSISVSTTGGTGLITLQANPYLLYSNGTFHAPAGTYTITATDENGCTAQQSVSITQPSQVVVTPVITPVSCNNGQDGKVLLKATGGSGSGYQFAQDNGLYSSSSEFVNLKKGDYLFRVKDNTGCEVIINTQVTEPQPLAIQIQNVKNVSCNGGNDGAFDVTVSGGNGSYTFNIDGIDKGTAYSFSDLTASNHTLTITDGKGCLKTIQQIITQPQALTAVVNLSDIICKGELTGAISVSGRSGSAPYQYALTKNNETPFYSENGAFNNLPAGNYKIWVKDNNNCI
ncbi:SprB repeat-containing protein [Rubrolithibacter danxiaensis]|uniref:SprB repeat-containing protein n=1 Tax=Rubrolithibacter danxiaensis TaxID=3390805 RepID=UPI003BF780E8